MSTDMTTPVVHDQAPQPSAQPAPLGYWAVYLELLAPVAPDDRQLQCFGDAEIDFERRALERLRPHLEGLLQTSPFQQYYVIRVKRCIA